MTAYRSPSAPEGATDVLVAVTFVLLMPLVHAAIVLRGSNDD